MHLFYCDETNLEEKSGDFLIYGGISIDCKKAKGLHNEIEKIRNDAGLEPNFQLKFKPQPENLSHGEFSSLKQSVIQSAIQHEVKLFVYLVLHDLAKSPDLARRNGINTVCYGFHRLLEKVEDSGLVLIDRFKDRSNEIDSHLRTKFSVGLTDMPEGYNNKRLSNILGFHYPAIGQSHFPSIVDIVLGSLRFAVNAHTRSEDKNLKTAEILLKHLALLFHKEGNDASISEISLKFSPNNVQKPVYRKKYDSLKEFLSKYGINADRASRVSELVGI